MSFHGVDVIIAEKLNGSWSCGIGKEYHDGFSMAHEAEEKAEQRCAIIMNVSRLEKPIL
jgi:hypothetical protein